MSCPDHLTHNPYCWNCGQAAREESARATIAMTGWTARSGCKACGAQPSPMATTQPTWCEACGACFTCGEPNVMGRASFHFCGPSPTAMAAARDILASGPTRPGYQSSTATYVEGREAPKREFADIMVGQIDPATGERFFMSPGVEACARAALDGYEGNDPPMYPHDWGQLPEADREAWREVARAVLAAAKGAK